MQAESGQTKLSIAFAGTPDFAVPALEAMICESFKPVAVLTQPDRRAGRGRNLQASPIKKCANEAQIEVLQPERLSGKDIQNRLRSMHLDLMIVAAYGLILPVEVLNIPRYGCWNIHASLLPRWRGAAPVQRAIEAGDKETGISIMQMATGLDTGPVFLQAVTPVTRTETGGSLHHRLAQLGAASLLDCLDMLAAGNMPEPVAQDDQLTTYAAKLDKAEAQIDWRQTAEIIEQRIRAFNPWPVCWFELNGERLRVWAAMVINRDCPGPGGTIVAADAEGIDICTGEGALRLLEVQKAGSKRMSVADYLNAHPVQAGL